MAPIAKRVHQLLDVTASEDDRSAGLHGRRVRGEVEFRRVYGHPSRLQTIHLPQQKLASKLDRTAVLEGTRRPGEIEPGQIGRYPVHVDRAKADTLAEEYRVADRI